MSQVALASKAELDRAFISRIERGIANPSVLTLANVCYALGITLADFFSDINVALPPGQDQPRRANAAQPKVSPPKSRLR
ncbi:helix-turn-helix domain-containing protein [Pseudoduganella umbonata]|nr:helix-turn-helix transcriptional regulator [Pseudoduganella umbonata]